MLFYVYIFIVTVQVLNADGRSLHVQSSPQQLLVDSRAKDRTFKIYWNSPTFQCASKGITFEHVSNTYGITQNAGDKFQGDKIGILYDPGSFPAILKNKTSSEYFFRNGGVPQEGDLATHIDLFKKKVEELFPDGRFNGAAVIDFESWRPIFRQNWGSLKIYKDVSFDIERKRHPFWPKSWVEKEAIQRFEEAGFKFVKETLAAAQETRPLAKWGYYAYPYCFNNDKDKRPIVECSDKVKKENDRIKWLWEDSQLLLPSVYMFKSHTPRERQDMVTGRIKEAKRLRKKSNSDSLILPYVWYGFHDSVDEYVSKDDLRGAISQIYNAGLDGAIIWGSSNDVNTVEKCLKLKDYVKNVLGPIATEFVSKGEYKSDRNVSESYEITTLLDGNEAPKGSDEETMIEDRFSKTIGDMMVASSQVNSKKVKENSKIHPDIIALLSGTTGKSKLSDDLEQSISESQVNQQVVFKDIPTTTLSPVTQELVNTTTNRPSKDSESSTTEIKYDSSMPSTTVSLYQDSIQRSSTNEDESIKDKMIPIEETSTYNNVLMNLDSEFDDHIFNDESTTASNPTEELLNSETMNSKTTYSDEPTEDGFPDTITPTYDETFEDSTSSSYGIIEPYFDVTTEDEDLGENSEGQSDEREKIFIDFHEKGNKYEEGNKYDDEDTSEIDYSIKDYVTDASPIILEDDAGEPTPENDENSINDKSLSLEFDKEEETFRDDAATKSDLSDLPTTKNSMEYTSPSSSEINDARTKVSEVIDESQKEGSRFKELAEPEENDNYDSSTPISTIEELVPEIYEDNDFDNKIIENFENEDADNDNEIVIDFDEENNKYDAFITEPSVTVLRDNTVPKNYKFVFPEDLKSIDNEEIQTGKLVGESDDESKEVVVNFDEERNKYEVLDEGDVFQTAESNYAPVKYMEKSTDCQNNIKRNGQITNDVMLHQLDVFQEKNKDDERLVKLIDLMKKMGERLRQYDNEISKQKQTDFSYIDNFETDDSTDRLNKNSMNRRVVGNLKAFLPRW